MINSMGEYLNLMKSANEFISKTKEADIIMFFSLIGTVIDQWCADHDIDSDETISMTKALADVQKEIHKPLGPQSLEMKSDFEKVEVNSMYLVSGIKYHNDDTKRPFTMRFNSLNDIFEYMKKISKNFSGKYGNYFPTRRGTDYDWCCRISCNDTEDGVYDDFWICQIENENGILYSEGRYTHGERFCAKFVESWLADCELKRKNNKPRFVEG